MAAGRLSLDLQYRIVDRSFVGQNKAVMENFKLGERVEAPNALDLPLDLAIALLTDSEGRITVAVRSRATSVSRRSTTGISSARQSAT